MEQEKKTMIRADFMITKHILLNLLVDMESLYFNGIWSQIIGDKPKKIKTLWHQN